MRGRNQLIFMLIDNYCKQTSIPVPNIDYKRVWNIDPTSPADTIPRWLTYPNNTKIWDDDTTNKLLGVGLKPRVIRVFRWRPNSVFPWHVDGNVDQVTRFAINWVLEGNGIIQWHSKLELPKPMPKHKHLAYGSLVGKIEDKFEFQALGHACVVNTVIPHRILNTSDVHRITVSILFGDDYSYNETVEKLKFSGFIK